MKSSIKHRLALAASLALVSAVAVIPSAPAMADEAAPVCDTLLSTTPGIEVDLNNDGNPEYRAPRIYDVTLCSDASYGFVTYAPTIENCSDVPKSVECMAFRVSVLPAYANANANGELCASIEGSGRTCLPFDTGSWDWAAPRVICVGYDLDGGEPCDGGMLAFE